MTPGWNQILITDRNGNDASPPWPAGTPIARLWEQRLPATARAVKAARQETCETLIRWGMAHLQENTALLVSELVTNAVRHTRPGDPLILLRLEATQDLLRIEVEDADPRWPQPRLPGSLDESGFGFVLVEALASTWGVRGIPAGKAVWAELRHALPA